MTSDEVARALAELGHARKAVQRPAAERLAAAARERSDGADGDRGACSRRPTAARAMGRGVRARPGSSRPRAMRCRRCSRRSASSDGDVRWASARLVVRAMQHEPALGDARAAARSARHRRSSGRWRSTACATSRRRCPSTERGTSHGRSRDGDPAVRLAAMAAALAVLPRTPAWRTASPRRCSTTASAGVRRAAAVTLGQLGVSDACRHADGSAPRRRRTMPRARAGGSATRSAGSPLRLRRLADDFGVDDRGHRDAAAAGRGVDGDVHAVAAPRRR